MEFLRKTFSEVCLRHVFFQIISSGKESKRKFATGNPFKNNVSAQVRANKFFEVNASAYGKI